MKRTLFFFGLFLLCSIPVYSLYSETTSALFFGNIAQVSGLVVAFLSYLRLSTSFTRNDAHRGPIFQLAFGMFIWIIAQALEMYCELVLHLIAYGTVSDAVWIVGYFPMFFALHTISTERRKKQSPAEPKKLHTLLGVLLGSYALVFCFFIWPQLQEPNQPFGHTLLDFLYPTLDFILVTQTLLIAKHSKRGSAFRAFGILTAVGVFVTFVGDAVLSIVEDFHSFTYLSVDIYYFGSYFLMALAADIAFRRRTQETILSVNA